MNWNNTGNFIEGCYKQDLFVFRDKVASFDLDGTLIKVKSGSKFPQDENDWILFSDTVEQKLQDLYKKKYCLIIISNQAGISKGKQDKDAWKNKLEQICNKINLPVKVYASIGTDHYRKPYKTFWNVITNGINLHKDSFYCGDACGRKNDHSDTDYKFALNCGINFCTPEFFFDNKKNNESYNVTYNVDLNHIKTLKFNNPDIMHTKNEMIIIVGFPGSGKTTFVNKYLVPLGYKRINMDTLKTKIKCIKECERQIDLGHSVVIDNTNPDPVTRKLYIDIAKKQKKCNIKCIEFTTNMNTAYHSTHYRCYKSNGLTKSIPMLVYHKYKKIYEEPQKKEGFDEIIKIDFCPPDDADFYNYYY